MRRAENKKPVGIPESIYEEMLDFAKKKKLFLFEVIVYVWKKYKNKYPNDFPKNRK